MDPLGVSVCVWVWGWVIEDVISWCLSSALTQTHNLRMYVFDVVGCVIRRSTSRRAGV
jgi:hypothetical protein